MTMPIQIQGSEVKHLWIGMDDVAVVLCEEIEESRNRDWGTETYKGGWKTKTVWASRG